MAIKLSAIGDKAQLSDERIGFNVLSPSNMKNYLVFSTVRTENGFSNRSKNVFWFPPREVATGDQVVLYTKGGQDSVKENTDGSKTYFYYWGLQETIFNLDDSIVVLAQLDTWKLSPSDPHAG